MKTKDQVAFVAGQRAERKKWVSAMVYQNTAGTWIFANPHELSASKIEFPDRTSARRACLKWLKTILEDFGVPR